MPADRTRPAVAAGSLLNRLARANCRLIPLVLALLGGLTTPARAAERRPNFLLIIADDLCWRDTGYEGNADVKTPNLDKLRGESMHLRGMFDVSPTCSPTRHALLTGLYNVRSGTFPNHSHAYDGTRSVFAELQDAGYRVALQHKADVRPPASFSFEHIQSPDDFTGTEQFMRRDPEQPWLLVFGSPDPHSPWVRGPKYDPNAQTIPPYLHDDPVTRALRAKYYGEVTELDGQVGALLRLLDKTGQANNTVVVFVSEQGSSFPYGGKWELYDNGIRSSSLVRWPGKVKPGSSSNALMQYIDIEPTFLAAAGIDPAKVNVHCPDANGGTGFDGRSILPVLLGKTDTLRNYVFAQETTLGVFGAKQPYPIRAVRDTRYKYIRNLASANTIFINGVEKTEPYRSWKAETDRNPKGDPQFTARVAWLTHRPAEELYDLQTDPYEFKNLADDPEFTAIKANLRTQLDGWMAQQGDKGLATELLAYTRQGRGNEQGEGGGD